MLNSFIDKSFAKYLGGILIVNLLTVATIAFLVLIFVICALKPGCLVYNWREVGASSRRYRYLSELYIVVEISGVPYTLAKLAISYCILHFGY